MTEQLSRIVPKSDTTIGWTRTTVQAFVTAILLRIVAALGLDLDTGSIEFVVIAGVLAGAVWTGSMWLADRVPALGYALFGVNKAPGYKDSPPAPENPIVQADPPQDGPPAGPVAEFGGFVGD